MIHPLIFSDLDGTLLDHTTYSYEPAVKLLAYLHRKNIPVVLNTSKTFAELVELRHALKNVDPFIVENGAAIYLPTEKVLDFEDSNPELLVGVRSCHKKGNFNCFQFSRDRSHWLSLLETVDNSLKELFTGFSTMSVEEISVLTGLDLEKASKANDRQFGEPVHWRGDELLKQQFIQCIETKGATVLQGGRFLHIGDKVNKGEALLWLKSWYEQQGRQEGKKMTTIALGDSHNDIDMLECADYAVVVRSPVNSPPELQRRNNVIFTKEYGPAGWARALQELLAIPEQELNL